MRPAGLTLAFRFAARELRAGFGGFVIFLALIALGVTAIAAVGSVSRAMTDGLAHEGAAINGGDIAFNLVQRQASDAERRFLEANGTVSEIATLRGMARRIDGNDQTLVEIKAVDGAYPLVGTLDIAPGGAVLDPARPLDALADAELLTRLGLAVGDSIDLGAARLRLAGIIASEPDKLATGLGFGPRLMISRAALDASALIQPGSLAQWAYRLRLPPGADLAAVTAAATKDFPDAGWQVRTRDDASPGLRRSIDQFAQYLTLVGLAALIVGGVGVANAVGAFIDLKRPVIATLRALGASARFVVAVYFIQIMLIALVGIAIGMGLGALVPLIALRFLVDVLPVGAASGFYPAELATAALFGLLTAIAFALVPLGRVRDVKPTSLFRDLGSGLAARVQPAFLVAAVAAAGLLALLSVLLAYDRRIAMMFVVAMACAFLLLRLVGMLVVAAARRAPRARSTELRFAVGNIHRPGALTASVVLSLGLGLTLLVAIALIDGSLQRQLTRAMPDNGPSFFFLDVPSANLQPFTAFLTGEVPNATIESVPMLRGQIVSVGGVAAADLKPAADQAWVLRGDRGVTFAATLPRNSRLVAGSWWPADYAGPPLVSLESGVAAGLGLKIGDSLVVNVLGRPVEAKIANLREVDWESLAINFVMVFSPNAFAGAPYSVLTTFAYPGAADPALEARVMKDAGKAFPEVTAVRVREALDRISTILGQLMLAIRIASSVALAASMLVLGGALAAGHRRRLHDAVILKTLGATRRQLVLAFGLEYGLLGLATALFGVAAGSLAAFAVVAGVMKQSFYFAAGSALGAAVLAVAVTIVLGLAGTWRLLGQKAAPVLRNL